MKDEDKAKERLKKELGEFRQRFIDIELKECLEHRKRLEEELEKCTRDLRERVKGLNLLLGISKLIEERDFSLEELLQGSVDLIPSAYYYPEIPCARIILKDKVFRTDNLEKPRGSRPAKSGCTARSSVLSMFSTSKQNRKGMRGHS